jgi:hypothetical protein
MVGEAKPFGDGDATEAGSPADRPTAANEELAGTMALDRSTNGRGGVAVRRLCPANAGLGLTNAVFIPAFGFFFLAFAVFAVAFYGLRLTFDCSPRLMASSFQLLPSSSSLMVSCGWLLVSSS